MIVLKSLTHSFLPVPKALLSLAVYGVALAGLSAVQMPAFSEDLSAEIALETALENKSGTKAETALNKNLDAGLETGTYLFGQSANREQIGSTYAVLSVQNGQTVGAFYQPHSTFSCFSGQVLADRLAVTVTDSYTQMQHPYAVALSPTETLVAGRAAVNYTLEGFTQLNGLSAQDHEILATCQADLLN